MNKLMPSIILFFTMRRQCNNGSRCMKRKEKKWNSDRKSFRWMNGRSMPYLDHLKENMPKICPNNWVVDQITEKYGRSGHYLPSEENALNIGIG